MRWIISTAQRFRSSPFARNVGVLAGGTTFAQAVAVLSLPLLTRLYTPEDFQLLSAYIALLTLFTTASCLRFDIAIPLPEQDGDAINLLALSVIAATAISGVLAVIAFSAPGAVAALMRIPDLEPYLWMVSLGVWIAAIYAALQYWASRKKRFSLVTRTRITRAIGGSGTQLGLGLFQPSAFGLLFGHMIYGGLGVLGVMRSVVANDLVALKSVSRAAMRRNFWAYRRFPIFSVPESLLDTAAVQLPMLIIAALGQGPEAGYLLIAMRVMGLPMGLIGRSVAQVFLSEAGERRRDGTLGAFTRRTSASLLKLGAPPLLLAGAISPFIFPVVFGEEWVRAGILISWLTPYFILQFAVSPVSMLLHVQDRQGVAMMLQSVSLVLRVGAVLAGAAFAPASMGELYAVSGAIFCALYLAVVLKVART